jgi:hypothetical protein
LKGNLPNEETIVIVQPEEPYIPLNSGDSMEKDHPLAGTV